MRLIRVAFYCFLPAHIAQVKNFIQMNSTNTETVFSTCEITNNTDGTIDIKGDIIVNFPLKQLPRIKNLIGNFSCRYNNTITTLQGAPTNVYGNFDCSNCDKLTSLNGAPLIDTRTNLSNPLGLPKVYWVLNI